MSASRVPATTDGGESSATASTGRDPVGILVLGALFLLSVWVLGWLVTRAIIHNEVWTGIDGLHASDQLQYLAWIRSAGHGGLISDLFVIRATPASFLHPGFLLTGAIFDLGVAPWLAYLLWTPVAVVALFLAVRAYVNRLIPALGARRAALVLALFFVSTAAFVASMAGARPQTMLYLLAIEVELWPGTWLWGYAFTVLAVAAIPAALLLYERDRARGRIGAGAPVAALLCSWLQPWQGATLLGILLVSEGISRARESRRPSLRLPALSLIAGSAPLLYYALLAHYDPAWTLAGTANHIGAWPAWTVLVSIAPLGLPSLLAYTVRPVSFNELSVRVWPLMGLALYWFMALAHVGTFAIHSFQGLTIPLAILAVTGLRDRVPLEGATAWAGGALAVAVLTVPALVWKLNDARQSTRQDTVSFLGAPPNPYFLTHGEAAALNFLTRAPGRGGVLTDSRLGEVVPAWTGRHTWVGLPSWTPNYVARSGEAAALFSGSVSRADARRLVRSSGAAYVIAGCEARGDVAQLIRPLVAMERRFGCAVVLALHDPG